MVGVVTEPDPVRRGRGSGSIRNAYQSLTRWMPAADYTRGIAQKSPRPSRTYVAGSRLAPSREAIETASPSPSAPMPEVRDLDRIASLSSDLECGGCGYQIAAYTTPPECPMCRERNWRPITTQSRPF